MKKIKSLQDVINQQNKGFRMWRERQAVEVKQLFQGDSEKQKQPKQVVTLTSTEQNNWM